MSSSVIADHTCDIPENSFDDHTPSTLVLHKSRKTNKKQECFKREYNRRSCSKHQGKGFEENKRDRR